MREMNSDSLYFRPARPADLDELHPIINQAYRTKNGWTTEAYLVGDERITRESLQTHLLNLQNQPRLDPIFVCEYQKQVVGCIQAELATDHPYMNLPEHSALIGLFAVDPVRQSQGIGRFLLNQLLAYLKQEMQVKTAVLWVIQQREDIQKWYERSGFEWKNEEVRPFVMPEKALQPNVYFKVYTKDLV